LGREFTERAIDVSFDSQTTSSHPHLHDEGLRHVTNADAFGCFPRLQRSMLNGTLVPELIETREFRFSQIDCLHLVTGSSQLKADHTVLAHNTHGYPLEDFWSIPDFSSKCALTRLLPKSGYVAKEHVQKI
jgi:hypothetical protein